MHPIPKPSPIPCAKKSYIRVTLASASKGWVWAYLIPLLRLGYRNHEKAEDKEQGPKQHNNPTSKVLSRQLREIDDMKNCSQVTNIHCVPREDAYTEKAEGLSSTDPASRTEAR